MWIADFLNGNPAGDAASLPVDAQQLAYDHMAKKLAGHLRRECSVIRFPSHKVGAAQAAFTDLPDDASCDRWAARATRTRANYYNNLRRHRSLDKECAAISVCPILHIGRYLRVISTGRNANIHSCAVFSTSRIDRGRCRVPGFDDLRCGETNLLTKAASHKLHPYWHTIRLTRRDREARQAEHRNSEHRMM